MIQTRKLPRVFVIDWSLACLLAKFVIYGILNYETMNYNQFVFGIYKKCLGPLVVVKSEIINSKDVIV